MEHVCGNLLQQVHVVMINLQVRMMHPAVAAAAALWTASKSILNYASLRDLLSFRPSYPMIGSLQIEIEINRSQGVTNSDHPALSNTIWHQIKLLHPRAGDDWSNPRNSSCMIEEPGWSISAAQSWWRESAAPHRTIDSQIKSEMTYNMYVYIAPHKLTRSWQIQRWVQSTLYKC